VKWVTGGAIVFLVLILTVPFLTNLFQFEKISITEALISTLAGLFSVVGFEMYKYIKGTKEKRRIQESHLLVR
jgi:Ca2+-transporting ATPase